MDKSGLKAALDMFNFSAISSLVIGSFFLTISIICNCLGVNSIELHSLLNVYAGLLIFSIAHFF